LTLSRPPVRLVTKAHGTRSIDLNHIRLWRPVLIITSFNRETRAMRTISLAFTTALAVCITAPAFAQYLPSDAQCHALARQRGAGESSGNRNHERFIRDCVAGKVSTTSPAIPESVREVRGMTSDFCHDLARQRGAGESSGNRNHERFIRSCMAGRVSVREIRTQTQDLGGDPRRSVMRSRGKGEQASQPEIETIKDLSGTAWREGCLNLPAIGFTCRSRVA
jgi:hypothetical protein